MLNVDEVDSKGVRYIAFLRSPYIRIVCSGTGTSLKVWGHLSPEIFFGRFFWL